ncbi:MAG: hypothetical protein ACFB02_19560 [Mastigocoleus sp.]
MVNWSSLLETPEYIIQENDCITNWFDDIASVLLNGYSLIVNYCTYRILEVEFYYFASNHSDIFAHQNPLQKSCGYWYFHRQGEKSYKNGSFKGLDITFGNYASYGGILIRSLESVEGKLIIGPSLCVDALLAQTNTDSIGELDKALVGLKVSDGSSIIRLEETSEVRNDQIFCSARIGLSLKKLQFISEKQQYILRPYRYLVQPRKVSKGKLHLVLALYIHGKSLEYIHSVTGSPQRTISKYIQDFEAGKQEVDFSRYVGINLNSQELSRLHGTCFNHQII